MTNEIDPQTGYKISPRTGKPEHAVLTEGQRQYLRGDRSGYTSSSQTDYEKAIARRVYNSYIDLSLIFKNLPENRREEIFDIGNRPGNNKDEEEQKMTANNLYDGLNDTVAFLFLLLEDEYNSSGAHGQIQDLTFRRVLDSGVSKAVKQIESGSSPWPPTVEVDFNVETSEPEWADANRIIDKIAEGSVDELSGAKARWFIQFMDKLENDALSQHKGWGVEGWEDLRKQIEERRAERDDIITREDMEELADLPDEEAWKRIENRQSGSDE